DRDHGLVEQGQAGGDLSQRDQAPALADPGEGGQLRVAEALAGLRRLREGRARRAGVALERGAQRVEVAEVAVLDAVQAAAVEQPLSPGDPPAAARQLAAVQQTEGQPEGATRGAVDSAQPR